MRIQIKGPITAARLANALEAIRGKFEEGVQFYGANLYLNCYDMDGLPTELADSTGDPIMFVLERPPGESLRPPLTEHGKAVRKGWKKTALLEKEEAAEAKREYQRKLDERRNDAQRRRDELEACYQKLNEWTALCLQHDAKAFVDDLNAVIARVWAWKKPVIESGKRKGTPREMPRFEHAQGILLLHSSAVYPRKLKNPIGTFKPWCYDGLAHFWSYEAWEEVTNQILFILEAHVTKLLGDEP